MRLALALCVVVGCGLCGNAVAASYRRRVELLTALAQGVRVLRVHMLRMLEPVSAALSGSGCAVLQKVGRGMAPGESVGQSWRCVAEHESVRGGLIDALNPADKQALDRLFEQLGESGREQQELLLSSTLELLARQLAEAEAAALAAERLYRSLGVLAGLMLALIVI